MLAKMLMPCMSRQRTARSDWIVIQKVVPLKIALSSVQPSSAASSSGGAERTRLHISAPPPLPTAPQITTASRPMPASQKITCTTILRGVSRGLSFGSVIGYRRN